MDYEFAESQSSATLEKPYSYSDRATISRGEFWQISLPAKLFRYRVIKRSIDIVLVLLALPIVLPVLTVVAILMKLTSPGPIFFSHRRIRQNGAFFSMWKFRTMCVNSTEVLNDYLRENPEARAEWLATHKLRYDPRVTPIGAFLRRYSIDELPQIWNVLAGTMSLVGPRPIVAAEVEKYKEKFEHYCRVKPGLTGIWQISGRSGISYDERVDMDCDYVNRWSLSRDFIILFKTFRAVLEQDGAF